MTVILILTAMIAIYFVVRRLISKSYHKGWLDGFEDAVVIFETRDEVCEELVGIIRKEADDGIR